MDSCSFSMYVTAKSVVLATFRKDETPGKKNSKKQVMQDFWKEIKANCKPKTRAQYRMFNKLKQDNKDHLFVERTFTLDCRRPEEVERMKATAANCVAGSSEIVLLRIEDEVMRRNPPSRSLVFFDC